MIKEYVLTLKDGFTPEQKDLLFSKYNMKLVEAYPDMPTLYVVEFDEEHKKAVRSEDIVWHAAPSDAPVESTSVLASQTISVNTNTGDNWGLARICQKTEWPLTLPLPFSSKFLYSRTGRGVDAYVIDSGVRKTHRDFGGRAQVIYDHFRQPSDPAWGDDKTGHGTHVSSTIIGARYGVAKGATVKMARAFDTGGTTLRVLAACFNAIMSDHKAKIAQGINRPSVLNMSISGNKTTTEEKLINDLINAGIVVVAAAGNNTLNMDAVGVEISPAEVLKAITVGAIDIKDRIATFSNYGSAVDIFAPGVSILGASNTSDTGTKRYSGTSMAAPHTAGVVCQKLEGEPIYTTGEQVQTVHDWIVGTSTPNRVAFSTQVAATATPNRILFSEFSMNEVAVASEEVIVEVETWMVKVLTKLRNFLDKLIFLFK